MIRSFRSIAVAAAVGAALVLSACGGGGGEENAGDKTIKLGFPGGIGPTDAPLIAAMNSLKDSGYTVEYIEFDSPDVQTQALMGGDINIASMGPATVMAANTAGANLKMVGLNNVLDYVIVASPDVNVCADLDGKTVAYHSEGSTSTAHLRRYLADNCPEAKPEFLVISGSSNRVTALLEGQIHGTIVRLEDWLAADADPARGHAIANLAETQADLLTQTIVIDGAKATTAGPAAADLLAALDEQFKAVNADPSAFSKVAAEILGEDADETLTVIQAMVDNGTFPQTSELSQKSVDATIAFYREAGTVDDSMTADKVADFSVRR